LFVEIAAMPFLVADSAVNFDVDLAMAMFRINDAIPTEASRDINSIFAMSPRPVTFNRARILSLKSDREAATESKNFE
jgi:hypothetical protein